MGDPSDFGEVWSPGTWYNFRERAICHGIVTGDRKWTPENREGACPGLSPDTNLACHNKSMANNVRTGGPGTAGATANFTVLREQSRRELTECIDRVRGPKALVLDPSLSGPLGLIAEKQLLKDHGIEKTYHLRSEPLETDQRRMVFLVRDSILNMKAVAAQVKYNQQRREKVGACMLFIA